MTAHATPMDPTTDAVFERLAQFPPGTIAGYLKNEAPVTAAAVLLQLAPAAAAGILNVIPAAFRHHALRCMANVGSMQPPAKAVIARTLDVEFPFVPSKPTSLDDIRRIVDLMSPELRDGALAALDAPPDARRAAETTATEPAKAAVPLNRPAPAPLSDPNDEFERLPLLEVVYDRLVRWMSTSLRRLTGANTNISLRSIISCQYGRYLNSIPLPAMMSMFEIKEWGRYGMLVTDRALIQASVETLLGANGRIDTLATRSSGYFTTIDRCLVDLVISSTLSDLSRAFEIVQPLTFELDRIETNPRFSVIAAPSAPAILARIDVEWEHSGGRLDLLIPYESLEPARDVLLQTVRPPLREGQRPDQGRAA
jgi:hypothetical protein